MCWEEEIDLTVDELEVWKNRAKVAEAKTDYYKNLAEERKNTMKPFVDVIDDLVLNPRRTQAPGIKPITEEDKEKFREAYYRDKTEGD